MAPIPVAACEHGKRRISGCLPTAQESKTGDPDEGNYRQGPCCRMEEAGDAEPSRGRGDDDGAGEEGIRGNQSDPRAALRRGGRKNQLLVRKYKPAITNATPIDFVVLMCSPRRNTPPRYTRTKVKAVKA
jgi:hypothetical protein